MCTLRQESQRHSLQYAIHGLVDNYIQIFLAEIFLDKASVM